MEGCPYRKNASKLQIESFLAALRPPDVLRQFLLHLIFFTGAMEGRRFSRASCSNCFSFEREAIPA